MELKDYQQRVLDNLGEYLVVLASNPHLGQSFKICWNAKVLWSTVSSIIILTLFSGRKTARPSSLKPRAMTGTIPTLSLSLASFGKPRRVRRSSIWWCLKTTPLAGLKDWTMRSENWGRCEQGCLPICSQNVIIHLPFFKREWTQSIKDAQKIMALKKHLLPLCAF